MWVLGGFNCSPAFDEGENEEESEHDVRFLFCAKQNAPVFWGSLDSRINTGATMRQ